MTHNNNNKLFTGRPGIFRPAFTRHALDAGASTTTLRLFDIGDTNFNSTASFRYDPTGTGLKSTQQLNVDWSKFEEHTFFNSAEVKVNVAFDSIINRFPFDGTRGEVEAFFDGLTGFEKWVFDSFPKNLGYLKFENGSFITVVDHAGSQFPSISRNRSGRSVLDPGIGSMTFEFHVHIPAVPNENQILLQKLSGTSQGFTVGLIGTGSTSNVDLFVSFVSASTTHTITGTLGKGAYFTHVVATYDRRRGDDKLYLYSDGQLIASSSKSVSLDQIDFTLSPLYIGSGSTVVTGSNGATFVPKTTLSGALDELRIFHDVRTLREIRKYAKTNIYAQDGLKLYFRFNEPSGVLGPNSTHQINRVVIDSSGNSLTSYIDESTFTFDLRSTGSLRAPLTHEEAIFNPVLFSTFAPIVEFNQQLLTSASAYDATNPNLITRLVPHHYFLEGQTFEALSNVTGTIADAIAGTGDGMPGNAQLGQPQLLSALLYVIAKELDEVKLFLDHFANVLFVDYDDVDTTPDQLLAFLGAYKGVDLPGFFNNASYEQFINAHDITDEFGVSESALQHVQNELWRRILSNLNEILRSKGTLHSIKAFIRSLGIDPEQNFRLREFGGPKRGRIGESRELRATTITMLDMGSGSESIRSPLLIARHRNEPGFPEPSGASTDVYLLSGSWTFEGTYKFPRRKSFTNYPTTQSLVRFATTGATPLNDAIAFNLLAISGTSHTSSSIKLIGKPYSGTFGRTLTLELTGVNVVDGQRWYVAFGRNRHDDPSIAQDNFSHVSSSYFLRAMRQEGGELVDEFVTSAFFMESEFGDHAYDMQQTISSFFVIGSQSVEHGGGYLSSAEQLDTTFYGMVGQIRLWTRGLFEDESREHVRNPQSVGVISPTVNFNFVENTTGSWGRLRIDAQTKQHTTSSSAIGEIEIFDYSQNNLHLSGTGFPATASIIIPEAVRYSVISPKYDESIAFNKVRIHGFLDYENARRYGGEVGPIYEVPAVETPDDDARFTIDFSVIDALNDDIINIFATLDEIEDSIGRPELLFVDAYHDLSRLRDVYFKRLVDRINHKAFFEFFRWFDMSIGMFIEQLIPRKTRYLGTNYVIESHMLERPKFMHKYDDVYVGDDIRDPRKDVILLRLITGEVNRY